MLFNKNMHCSKICDLTELINIDYAIASTIKEYNGIMHNKCEYNIQYKIY